MAEQTQKYPKIPSGATEELRRRLADRGRSDLYFLAQGILGYDKIVPHTHAAFTRFVQGPICIGTDEVRRRMIQMPRSHYKTTLATIARPIQLILNDPNVRILLVASSAANAERFLLEIKNHFKRNELFRWIFQELIPENEKDLAWNKQEMTVPREIHFREPTIDTIGSKGDVQSRHYDWIIADDIIGEKELQSETEMTKTIEWCSGLESLLVSPITGHIDYVGTRWRMDDVYAWVEDFYAGPDKKKERSLGPYAILKGELAIFRREALENGKPIFPEQISLSFLSRLMRENPERYAAQYANNPRAKGITTFDEAWLRYFVWNAKDKEVVWYDAVKGAEQQAELETLERYILFDPAVAEHRTSARNAILVVGVLARPRVPLVFLLETRIGHYKPHEAVDYLFELDKTWQPSFISIERYGFQGALKYWITERAERDRLPYLNILEYPPKGTSTSQLAKDERIKGLQPLFRSGQILLQESQVELIEEFLYYPRGTWRDALDALAQGLSFFGTSYDETREAAAEEYADKIAGSIDSTGYGVVPGSPLDLDRYEGLWDEDPGIEGRDYDTLQWRGKVLRVC